MLNLNQRGIYLAMEYFLFTVFSIFSRELFFLHDKSDTLVSGLLDEVSRIYQQISKTSLSHYDQWHLLFKYWCSEWRYTICNFTVIHVLSNYKCHNFFSPMKRKFCFITVFNVYLLFIILSQHQMIKIGFCGCLQSSRFFYL